MPNDKIKMSRKEFDEVYQISEEPKEEIKEESNEEFLTAEEQEHDDKLAETLHWNDES